MKSKYDRVGKAKSCDACGTRTYYYVCPLKHSGGSYNICLNCYEKESWQAALALKETTTKTGSSNYSKRGKSKPKSNRSLEAWAASIGET